MTAKEIAYQARTYPHRDIEKMILDYTHNAVVDALSKKQVQAEFPISFTCQMDIEGMGICIEQCSHCKEYFDFIENGDN